ncbi:hypothetical protein Lal_00022901, partial [Lupinus albus]
MQGVDAIVVRGVHDVGTNAARQDKLETKIDSLTTLITQLAINQQKIFNGKSMWTFAPQVTIYNDMCPSLLEPRTGDHPERMLQTYTTTELHISRVSLIILKQM